MIKLEVREGGYPEFTALKYWVEPCIKQHHVPKHNLIWAFFEKRGWNYVCYWGDGLYGFLLSVFEMLIMISFCRIVTSGRTMLIMMRIFPSVTGSWVQSKSINNTSNFPSPSAKDHNHLNPSCPAKGILSLVIFGGLLGISHLITNKPFAFFHSSLLQCHIDLGNTSITRIMLFKKIETCPFCIQ